MLNLSIGGRRVRGRPAGDETILRTLSLAEPVTRWERLGEPVRLAAQSLLIMTLIVATTFALLVFFDYAGIRIAPTGDMLAAS